MTEFLCRWHKVVLRNLKPDLVMDAFAKFAQVTLPEYVTYERLDMYCLEDDNLVSLDDIGGNIE